jgi:hypothetical protein
MVPARRELMQFPAGHAVFPATLTGLGERSQQFFGIIRVGAASNLPRWQPSCWQAEGRSSAQSRTPLFNAVYSEVTKYNQKEKLWYKIFLSLNAA